MGYLYWSCTCFLYFSCVWCSYRWSVVQFGRRLLVLEPKTHMAHGKQQQYKSTA